MAAMGYPGCGGKVRICVRGGMAAGGELSRQASSRFVRAKRRISMLGPAFFLSGDSFPGDSHVEDALRPRLQPAFSELIGQRDLLTRAGETQFDSGIARRLALLRQLVPPQAVLIGRSSGARVASLFAMRGTIAAVICVGYPFRDPGRVLEPDRFAHLAYATVPTLMLQGLQDRYGGADLTENYALSPSVTVRFIDCSHEFRVPPREWDAIGEIILGFCDRVSKALPIEQLRFDEAYYLNAHPDVAAAVAEGRIASGHDHFQKRGRREGRRFRLVQDFGSIEPDER
jgi:pimeloyl-ACP methyl ester carboxylesterase